MRAASKAIAVLVAVTAPLSRAIELNVTDPSQPIFCEAHAHTNSTLQIQSEMPRTLSHTVS
jgi:hypothetical protein